MSARPVNTGDIVQSGDVLFEVIDPTTMYVEGTVPSAQLGMVRVGSPVTFTSPGIPNRTFAGRVERVNPAADPTTRQVPIFITIQNGEWAARRRPVRRGSRRSDDRSGAARTRRRRRSQWRLSDGRSSRRRSHRAPARRDRPPGSGRLPRRSSFGAHVRRHRIARRRTFTSNGNRCARCRWQDRSGTPTAR